MAELTFTSGGRRLAGSLDRPAGEAVGAALLLPGSGPLDRDGNGRGLPLTIQRQLATALTAHGWATLRYDRRGIGASEGDFRATGLVETIDDAHAALDALTAATGLDRARCVVIGHSEGALVGGALAARAEHADPPLGGLVLLSPFARPGEELLLWQARTLEPLLPAPVRAALRLSRRGLEARVRRNHATIKATSTDVARIGLARINARWHREFLAYDPRDDLRRATCPVLAITGRGDVQVPVDDLGEIARLTPGPVETLALPGLSHVLRPQDGPAAPSAYRRQARGPVDRRVLDAVTAWLDRLVAPAERPAPA